MNAGFGFPMVVSKEAVISREEALVLAASLEPGKATNRPVDAERLRLLIESARVRLAYTHDRQFAVSLSGIRRFAAPDQLVAVYQRMLPQPRLRFLLADDPGAGKTIMAGGGYVVGNSRKLPSARCLGNRSIERKAIMRGRVPIP